MPTTSTGSNPSNTTSISEDDSIAVEQDIRSTNTTRTIQNDDNNNNNNNNHPPHLHHQFHTEQQKQQQHQDQNQEQNARRKSIQQIMNHPNLTCEQRRHSIQILMDSRRRSQFGETFEDAARNVMAELEQFALGFSSDEDMANNDYESIGNDSNKKCNNENNNNNRDTDEHTHNDQEDMEITDDERKIQNNKKCINHIARSMYYSPSPSSSFNNNNNDNTIVAYTLTGTPCGNPKIMEENRPPCTHYNRNCSMISPCCGIVFGCRICHDELVNNVPFMNFIREERLIVGDDNHQSKIDHKKNCNSRSSISIISSSNKRTIEGTEEQEAEQAEQQYTITCNSKQLREKYARRRSISSFNENGNNEMHHTIDRYAVDEVICRQCFTRQSSKRYDYWLFDIHYFQYVLHPPHESIICTSYLFS